MEKRLFKGMKVGEEFQYSILQYTDDSVMVGQVTHDSLWAIKAIFRGFELVSGLLVNFLKSVFYGIGTNQRLDEPAANFLSCRVASPPFHFLGLLVGVSPTL